MRCSGKDAGWGFLSFAQDNTAPHSYDPGPVPLSCLPSPWSLTATMGHCSKLTWAPEEEQTWSTCPGALLSACPRHPQTGATLRKYRDLRVSGVSLASMWANAAAERRASLRGCRASGWAQQPHVGPSHCLTPRPASQLTGERGPMWDQGRGGVGNRSTLGGRREDSVSRVTNPYLIPAMVP